MGRKKKTEVIPTPPKKDEYEISFDTKAILLMACIQYNVRDAIVKLAPNYHRGLGPIPRSSIMAAIRELGLESLLWEEDLKEDDD